MGRTGGRSQSRAGGRQISFQSHLRRKREVGDGYRRLRKDGKVNMIEAGAKEIGEEIAIKGIEGALEEIAKMEEFQKK